jgi:D-alanyl-lipoteichoic acid acyltransferase DltB (MBOAT superfamily)
MQELIRYIGSVFSFDPNSPLLFTQFHFWAFFALVFAGFALAKQRRLLRNSYLFFVSLLFYYKTSGLFVGLLILVTCTDFFIAQAIHSSTVKWKKRAWLVLSVTIDLGILCYFKYAYFFADMVHSIFGFKMTVSNVAASAGNAIIGTDFFDADRIILPVGISFYTFQVISYTADVYKGLVKPVRNILDFGFYVTFFPQLVAGPIVKASDFIPQLYKKYNLSHRMFGIAVFWIINGLIKKIVLSDYLAVNFIDRVFDNPHLFSGFENLMSLFVYSLQVYADFSGYTDIAIGLSLLMGFHLPMNFNSPYKALNCSNFWKRWHISLSRWLQTYLYIPLGGNRNITFGTYFWIIVITLAALVLSGSWWVAAGVLLLAAMVIYTAYRHPERRKKIYANLNAMITMLLGGLWHGASLNFVIWGGLNGVGMVVYKFWRDNSPLWRVGLSLVVVAVLYILIWIAPMALWNVLIVCAVFIAISAVVRWLYSKYNSKERNLKWLANSWAILVTFTFISFTRLFFRSGSNLDPATANEVAWKTAKSMVQQMGTSWNVNVLDVLWGYHNVFLLFVIGMVIHWLPVKLKRRYRLTFASLPLPAMGAIVVVAVFFIYQFVTAEMQPFIYFQF